jgi:hypothetical protein
MTPVASGLGSPEPVAGWAPVSILPATRGAREKEVAPCSVASPTFGCEVHSRTLSTGTKGTDKRTRGHRFGDTALPHTRHGRIAEGDPTFQTRTSRLALPTPAGDTNACTVLTHRTPSISRGGMWFWKFLERGQG